MCSNRARVLCEAQKLAGSAAGNIVCQLFNQLKNAISAVQSVFNGAANALDTAKKAVDAASAAVRAQESVWNAAHQAAIAAHDQVCTHTRTQAEYPLLLLNSWGVAL